MTALDDLMRQAIDGGVFPGASLLVARGEKVIHRAFYGNATILPKAEPVTETTLWDVASLTKPVATAALTLASIREKGLSLNSTASKYLSEMGGEDKGKITIRHLLKHTSGLPAWKPYFEDVARERPDLIGRRESRTVYVEKISKEPLEAPIAYRRIYSDLGYILLGAILEDFWGKPLDALFTEKIAGPLGLRNTFYLPVGVEGEPCVRSYTAFAATEDSVWRKNLVRGEVHDDNAYVLGGVAGHAGLFSHVDDLHRFLVSVREGLGESNAKLGWDTPSQEKSQAGKYFSKSSIGHLGYTGCSMWLDPEKDFHVILLTNRVHPTAKNEEIKKFRPKVHDAIFEELIRE